MTGGGELAFDISVRAKAEEALRERESIFSAIATQASDGIVLIDTETLRFTEFNDAACGLLGYSRAEFERMTLADIQPQAVHFADLLRLVKDHAMKGGVDFKHHHRCKDGTLRPVLLSNRSVDIHGRVYLAAIWHDITERERIEQELLNYRQQLEKLVALRTAQLSVRAAEIEDLYNRAPCGYHSRDKNGTLLAVNDTELAMLGYTRDEVEGKLNIRQLMTVESRALFDAHLGDFAATGKVRDLELDFVRKDGTILPVRINSDLVCDANGEFLHTRSTLTDNSERKRAEAALRASEERYRSVVEDQTEVICRFDNNGWLIFANDVYCRFFGKSPEDLVGTTWHPVAVAEDIPYIDARLKAFTAANPVVVIENRVYAGDGRIHWMQFVNRGFFDEDGQLQEIQSVGRDITERKQVEMVLQAVHAELEQRVMERTTQLRRLAVETTLAEERERRAIARDLHDDLGQILHVVKIKLDALAKLDALDPARLAELNDLVGDSSRMVRSLTSQLSPPALETLGLGAALNWLGEEMERIYGLSVVVRDDGLRDPPSKAQAAILFRAVRELLINVAKHAEVDEARVAMDTHQETLVISVEDDGIGFAGWEEATEATDQWGFGLASVRERIHFLGGTMEIRSHPGMGTAVTLQMPVTFPELPEHEATL